MSKEILSFIGLMSRAGALITGTELVLNGVRSGKVKLVLIDAHASENTLKKITSKCHHYHVAWIQLEVGADLGLAIGKPSRKVVGITDQQFVKALKEKLQKCQA
ncbi:MAG: ribosomal L7Ae/L30e/S12e/Gadd45 family protein [Defluviitaleaceae bacterium]|nr:ribosomal L7Ae/L30e/S12e/Gadd45 family protein [Defluviitaleaceae bacterium]